MTARWVVEQVAPHRDLQITWQPISLLVKNDPPPDSDYFQGALLGHRALRIMEALRHTVGEQPIGDWYWQTATRIHHDQERPIDFAAALTSIGADPALAAAADEPSWDSPIKERMNAGLELVGPDVGTPIIAFTPADGHRRGIFGPVLTEVPDPTTSLALWEAMEVFATTEGFWELKRTRTTGPQFGARPSV